METKTKPAIKVLNYKPRFNPREHKPTLPIQTFPPTNTTTATQNTQPRFKQHTSSTTTQYTPPTPEKNTLPPAPSPSCCYNILLLFIANQTPTTH